MPCTNITLQSKDGSSCHIHKHYIEAGAKGGAYHGELCVGCLWWEDSDNDIAFWAKMERLGFKRDIMVIRR